MDLYEYQAKELFALHSITTQVGKVVENENDAKKAAQEFNQAVVVKAQVKIGGRGKAGGVKLAENSEDAFAKAQAILGMDIKGHRVNKVMIAQAAPIESEYYLALLLDR